jgi:hypothetical protein
VLGLPGERGIKAARFAFGIAAHLSRLSLEAKAERSAFEALVHRNVASGAPTFRRSRLALGFILEILKLQSNLAELFPLSMWQKFSCR